MYSFLKKVKKKYTNSNLSTRLSANQNKKIHKFNKSVTQTTFFYFALKLYKILPL